MDQYDLRNHDKITRSAERALHREPDHDSTHRYAQALAGVLRKWFGDEAKLVAAELARILGAQ